MMDRFKELEARYGDEAEITTSFLDKMIVCKEMAEALIGIPVNLRKDGKVTTGF